MKKLRKVMAVILTGILGVSVFTGCDNGSVQSAENGNNMEKTVIEYWHVNAETQGGQTVEELVNEFNKNNDHIEVIARYNPDMYKGLMQNLQAETAAGNSPAIVQIGWSFLDYFSNNFSYTPPQEIIDKYFPNDANFFRDNFLPNLLELGVNIEGKQVGAPYSLSNPVMYCNVDLLKEAGLSGEAPKSWEEVIEYSKQIKENTGIYGFYMEEPAYNWTQQAIIESNGAKMITNENGNIKATFASPEGIEAFQAYADMIVKDKTALHTTWDEGMQAFVNGEVAMVFTTIAQRANIQKSAKFNVISAGAPVWEGKDRVIPAGGCFLAITAQDEEQKKAAWEFEKYLYDIESMAKWTIGTGYVPPRTGVAEAENGLKSFLEENKMMNAALSQMDDIVSWASYPGDAGLQSEQILIDTREEILAGNVSAKEGLTKAQSDINALLEQQGN